MRFPTRYTRPGFTEPASSSSPPFARDNWWILTCWDASILGYVLQISAGDEIWGAMSHTGNRRWGRSRNGRVGRKPIRPNGSQNQLKKVPFVWDGSLLRRKKFGRNHWRSKYLCSDFSGDQNRQQEKTLLLHYWRNHTEILQGMLDEKSRWSKKYREEYLSCCFLYLGWGGLGALMDVGLFWEGLRLLRRQ